MEFNSNPSFSVKYFHSVFPNVYLRSALRILLEKGIENIYVSFMKHSDLFSKSNTLMSILLPPQWGQYNEKIRKTFEL